jgi:hypothetical protein
VQGVQGVVHSPVAPWILTGVARIRRILPAFPSSSFRCFAVRMVTLGWEVQRLPSHTSHVALHISGEVHGSADSRIQPRAFPLSFVAFIYHLLDWLKNSSHLFESPRFW